MILPLPNTLEGTSYAPRTIAYPHNCYQAAGGVLLGRTGIMLEGEYTDVAGHPTGSTDHVPRGSVATRDDSKLYQIFGDRLFKTTAYYSSMTYLTTIDMPTIHADPIQWDDKITASFATSYTTIAIATGAENYTLDPSTDTLAIITDTDLPPARSVVYLDGYYVWVATDGETVHWSEVNDPTAYGALSFFDAESRPDKNLEAVVLGNDLFILGEKSIERFRPTGVSTAPFTRVTNSIISIGYVGGLVQKGDSITFIGKSVNSSYEVYELSLSSLRILSNGVVSEILNNSYTSNYLGEPIKSCMAQTWVDKGRPITSFRIGNGGSTVLNICLYCVANIDGSVSWGTLSDNPANADSDYRSWGTEPFIRESGQVGEKDFTWVNAVFYQGYYIFQRHSVLAQAGHGSLGVSHAVRPRDSGAIGELGTGVEEPVSKGFRVFIENPNRKDFNIKSLEVGYAAQKQSTHVTTDVISLRLSRSGAGDSDGGVYNISDWTAAVEKPITARGEGRTRFDYTGGIIPTNGYASIIIESNSGNALAFERLIINE